MQEKIDDIKHIQNTIWSMYKIFLSDHDVQKWNDGVEELTKEYEDKKDQQLLTFVQWLLIAWCPIISWFKEGVEGESHGNGD